MGYADQVVRRLAEVRAQQRHQTLGKVAAGEIVDAAIALGLADNCDNVDCLDSPLRNQFRSSAERSPGCAIPSLKTLARIDSFESKPCAMHGPTDAISLPPALEVLDPAKCFRV